MMQMRSKSENFTHVFSYQNGAVTQPSGQDGDTNDQDDQVIPPRCNEDIEACH